MLRLPFFYGRRTALEHRLFLGYMATIITISAHTAAAAHGVTINTQVGSTSNQQVRQLIKRARCSQLIKFLGV